MRNVLGDLRLGVRTLGKTPGPALVAVLALAVGIGLTTTMFSIVYGALLRGLPYPGGDRVMIVYRSSPTRSIVRQTLSIQDLVDYREQQHSFTALGAYTSGTVNVSGVEGAQRFSGSWMTADVFRVLQVPPLLGRVFRSGEDEPDGGHVVVLGYDMWRDRYGGDEDVVGRSIRVNGEPYTVIGVMPEGFAFPAQSELWLPLQTDPLATERGQGQFVVAVGRLKPDASRAGAANDVSAIAERLAARYPEADGGFDATAVPFVEWSIGPQPRRLLYTMLGAVFCVLLIACANVANLLLDRAAHRTKEVGIRTALGASRWQILRQFLVEASVLAFGGVVVGIGIAWLGVTAFKRAMVGVDVPFFIKIAMFPPVLAFAVGAGLVATFASGGLPALQSSRTDINEVLKDESRGASSLHIGRMSKGLVMLEVALSCALLVAAGLMVKSVTRMRTMDPGFDTESVFTARVGFPAVYTDTIRQKAFFRRLEERVASLPGVRAASISSGLPGAQQGLGGSRFAVDGRSYSEDVDYPTTRTLSLTSGTFATLGIRPTRGRLLTDADREDSQPVAVVTQRFVDRFLSGDDPLGRRIRLGTADSKAPWRTIVGVVPNVFGGDPEEPRPPVVFLPFGQSFSNFVYISARTAGAPMAITTQVRQAAAALEPDVPLYWVMPLAQAIAQPLWFVRVFGTMFMIFGFVALFLAAVGLYAVMAFSVSRRTREVGIRMAMGAPAHRVVRMIMAQGLTQLAVGMIIGLAGALAISRLMVVILFDVRPRDPLVFGLVALTLLLTGLLATGIPAFRATAVDPATALHTD